MASFLPITASTICEGFHFPGEGDASFPCCICDEDEMEEEEDEEARSKKKEKFKGPFNRKDHKKMKQGKMI